MGVVVGIIPAEAVCGEQTQWASSTADTHVQDAIYTLYTRTAKACGEKKVYVICLYTCKNCHAGFVASVSVT